MYIYVYMHIISFDPSKATEELYAYVCVHVFTHTYHHLPQQVYWGGICTYICVYIYICDCIIYRYIWYIHIYTHIYDCLQPQHAYWGAPCICVYMCMYICNRYSYIHSQTYVYIHTYINICIYTHSYTCMYICIYRYRCMYIYLYIYGYISLRFKPCNLSAYTKESQGGLPTPTPSPHTLIQALQHAATRCNIMQYSARPSQPQVTQQTLRIL